MLFERVTWMSSTVDSMHHKLFRKNCLIILFSENHTGRYNIFQPDKWGLEYSFLCPLFSFMQIKIHLWELCIRVYSAIRPTKGIHIGSFLIKQFRYKLNIKKCIFILKKQCSLHLTVFTADSDDATIISAVVQIVNGNHTKVSTWLNGYSRQNEKPLNETSHQINESSQ